VGWTNLIAFVTVVCLYAVGRVPERTPRPETEPIMRRADSAPDITEPVVEPGPVDASEPKQPAESHSDTAEEPARLEPRVETPAPRAEAVTPTVAVSEPKETAAVPVNTTEPPEVVALPVTTPDPCAEAGIDTCVEEIDSGPPPDSDRRKSWFLIRTAAGSVRVCQAWRPTPKTFAGPFPTREEACQAKVLQ